MDNPELVAFLNLSLKEIEDRYGQLIDGRIYLLNRPTKNRVGSFFPRGGFRNLAKASDFVQPGQTKTEKGRLFSEEENFMVSDIGEIAS